MLITFGQLNTLHYGEGTWGRRETRTQPDVLAPLSHPHSCLLGPNWTLGVWSLHCRATGDHFSSVKGLVVALLGDH